VKPEIRGTDIAENRQEHPDSLLKVTERFFIEGAKYVRTYEDGEGKMDGNRTKYRRKGTRFGWKCGGSGLFLKLFSHDYA